MPEASIDVRPKGEILLKKKKITLTLQFIVPEKNSLRVKDQEIIILLPTNNFAFTSGFNLMLILYTPFQYLLNKI